VNRSKRLSFAFTLVETVIAGGVFAVVSAAIITGVIALQRNFSNTRDYAVNHSAQLRISDYIARDLRQAITFSQTGTGAALSMTLTVPNYYDSTGKPRTPVVKADGSVVYQDTGVAPPKESSTIRYFINGETMYREVDGAPRPIAENVAAFVIIPLDSAADPTAVTDFNLSGITSKVAEVKVQVNFRTKFGRKSVTQVFYNTTLMRNSRTDAQTNLY
jgi:type II secretory pathway pseudopilin PulG